MKRQQKEKSEKQEKPRKPSSPLPVVEEQGPEETPGGVTGEFPEDIRTEHARKGEAEGDKPPRKKYTRKKKKEIEPELALAPDQIEKLVCFPFDFAFNRLHLPILSEGERKQMADASAPLIEKYGGFLAAWAPEAYFCMVIIAVCEPRVALSREMTRMKKRAEVEVVEPEKVHVSETPDARQPLNEEDLRAREAEGQFQSPVRD